MNDRLFFVPPLNKESRRASRRRDSSPTPPRGSPDRHGHPRQAADWLRQAVALAPHDRETLYNLSRCLQSCGPEGEARDCQVRFERADADLKRLGQLTKEVLREPRNPALRCEGGLIFLRDGEEEEGVRWLNQALRLDPGYRPAHAALADYYQRSGKSELAAHHRRLAEANKQTRPPSQEREENRP